MRHTSRDIGRRPRPVLPDRSSLAVEVLGFLAADEERLGRFLAITGATPATLRQEAASRGFADALLSYLASDEALLVQFASEQGYPPEAVGRLVQSGAEEG